MALLKTMLGHNHDGILLHRVLLVAVLVAYSSEHITTFVPATRGGG